MSHNAKLILAGIVGTALMLLVAWWAGMFQNPFRP